MTRPKKKSTKVMRGARKVSLSENQAVQASLAYRLITRLGGLGLVSHEMGMPTSTVWGWMTRDKIMAKHIGKLKKLAKKQKVEITEQEYADVIKKAEKR